MKCYGSIKKLEKIVVSDPHYMLGVWCRYERDFSEKDDWNVHILINNVNTTEEYKGEKYDIRGTEFIMAIVKKGELCIIKEDGSFSHSSDINIKNTEIGMDTAQVSMGVNEHAQEIVDYAIEKERAEGLDVLEDYRPCFAISTLTDGTFGSVREGFKNDEVRFLVIDGYIDEDADVSVEDLADYLKEQFNIEDFSKELEQQEELEHDDK